MNKKEFRQLADYVYDKTLFNLLTEEQINKFIRFFQKMKDGVLCGYELR